MLTDNIDRPRKRGRHTVSVRTVTYTVSGCIENVPHFFMQIAVGNSQTVFHPVLRKKSQGD